MNDHQALGVDIGNVIIDHRSTDPNDMKLHEERYSTIPASTDAFEAIHKLNTYFNGQVYLISKCTPWAEEKILAWLSDNDFYKKTGVNTKNVRFVRERHEKDAICQKLGITHFIDDRLEVLSHMVRSTPNLFLFQPDKIEIEEFKQFLPDVTVVSDWKDVLSEIIA